MANQYLPDTFGAMTNAFAAGRQMRDKESFNSLAQQAYGAQGDARQQAIQQMVGIDPSSGMKVGGELENAEIAKLKKMGGAARYLKQAIDSGNPQQIQGAWNAVRPMLQREIPEGQFGDQWDSATMEPVLHQVLAMTSGHEDGYRVQSTKIGADGFIYTIGRDGTPVNTGIKADPRTQFVDVPGVGPQMVTMSGDQRGTAAPVMPAGSPQTAAPAAAPPAYGPPPEINVQALPGADIPPQDLPAMMAAAENPGSVVAVAPSGAASMLAAPPAAAQPAGPAAPAWVRPDYAGQNAVRADAAAQRADAAEARAAERSGIPAGYEPDGMGGIRYMRGGPADPEVIARNAAAKPNAAGAKTMAAIKAKVPQLQNAIRGLGRIETAMNALDMPGINTGPLDQYAVRQLPAGQELEAAVGGIQNSFLALTRVPGIGSQSDLEARIAMLQYPSLDKAPEVNKRTLENLKLFARDLAKAYELAVTQGVPDDAARDAQPQQSAGAARPTTDAEFDALPSGALFVDPDDGQTYRKP